MSKEKRFELLNMLSFKDKFFDNKNKKNLDSLDVVGILNHYDKTLSEFVKRDIEQQNKIADLETKLAESESENKQLIKALNGEIFINYKLPMENAQLKQQLAEKEEQLKSDWYKICPRCKNPYGASQFPSKDENGKKIYICSNCNEKELFYEPLIKQLEDQNDRLIKERDDANLKLSKLLLRVSEQNEEILNLSQDKRDFCIEKLTKVKLYAQHIQGGLINYIEDLIKQLKEGK